MIYKSLNKDFFYVDSGSIRLSYYLACEGETIYTGRAYNPKGIKLNIRKLIEDWLENTMPDFRSFDGVMVEHPEACRVFSLYDDEGSLLEEYMVFLSYEDLDMPMFTYRGINGHADPRQKLFFCGLSDTAFSLTFDVTNLFFNISNATVGWTGGIVRIPYSTNYPKNKYYFDVPDGITLISYGNGELVVSVPKNYGSSRSFTITAHRTIDDLLLGTCVLTQRECTDYLTIEALEAGELHGLPYLEYDTFEWNKNGTGWHGGIVAAVTKICDLGPGDVVYLRQASGEGLALDSVSFWTDWHVDTPARFKVYGNLMSLVYRNDFDTERTLNFSFDNFFEGTAVVDAGDLVMPAENLCEYAYRRMFKDCTLLERAPVSLPAGTLSRGCYDSMFEGCTSLETPPHIYAETVGVESCRDMFKGCSSLETTTELNATTVGANGYESMFSGCTSLTGHSRIYATTLGDNCFKSMFEGCTSLVTSQATLPATTLQTGCYKNMYKNCSSLVQAPSIPATQAKESCCEGMFYGCSSLVQAPVLSATTLYRYCYASMFEGCTSLVQAPVLPAESYDGDMAYYWYSCYSRMFADCSALTYIDCSLVFTGESTSYCDDWVLNVASGGTFVKNQSNYDWPLGDDGIPFSWYDRSVGYTGETGDYSTQYLTLDIVSGGTLQFGSKYSSNYETNNEYSTIMFSLNGGDWQFTRPVSGYTHYSAITVQSGDTVLLMNNYNSRKDWNDQKHYYAPTLYQSTALFNVRGNAMSLIYGTDFRSAPTGLTTSTTYAFASLFEETGVVDARNMVLPTGYYPKYAMFLTFKNSTHLTASPVIAPDSISSTDTADVFAHTFYGCTSLSDIVYLYDTNYTTVSYARWVYNVSPTGTFTKKSSSRFASGENGIPSGWTVINIA